MLDVEKILESINDIDDELIARSELEIVEGKKMSFPVRCLVETAKFLAACVVVVLVSASIYETNKEVIQRNEEESTEHKASVIDVSVFDVGLTEDGKITNKYYAIATAIGNINYGGKMYQIVTGVDVEKTGLGEKIDTYYVENRNKDIFEDETIQVAVYRMNDMVEDMAVAFSVNGEDIYYMAVNPNYVRTPDMQ